MSLSHCIDKAQNEIRRHKILLQKEKKPDEALAYEKEQSAALKELKSMLDLQALDGEENKGKAIAKLKSVIESLSLDRDEVVIQIEAKGGKATEAPFKIEDLDAKPVSNENKVSISLGGGEISAKLEKPLIETTLDELVGQVKQQKLEGWKDSSLRQFTDKHYEAVKLAVDSGASVPDEVLVAYPGLIRSDLNDDQRDLMSDDLSGISGAARAKAIREWKPKSKAPEATTKHIKDENGNTVTEVTLPSGKKVEINKLNSAESMGLPGWHGPSGYLADTREGAIKALVEKDATANVEKEPDSSPEVAFDAKSAWEGMTPSQRFSALDAFAGAGQTDMGQRYKDRVWDSFNVGEKSTLSNVLKSAQKSPEVSPEPVENDRNTFTLERLNQKTGAMESLSFERGEYVQYTVGGKELFGEISGISHAKNEFAVDGLWYPFGFAYKADRPEAAGSDKKVSMSSVIDSVNKKNSDGLTEADRIPNTDGIVEQHSATIAKMFEGELSIDEFKAAFALVRDNRESIEAELSKLKKDALLKMGGANFAYRYKTETKPVIIRGLYGDMLGDFTLNKTLSYFVGGNMADAKNKAIQKIVDESTQADMDAFGERVKERRAENEKRAEEIKSAVNDPKTLDDFRLYLRAEMAKGKTDKEARMTMTPEQRATYDNFAAEYSRKLRADRKETANTNISAAAVTTAGQLFETKHTKTGEDLFVVKTADRVERDVYNLWNATAKKLGGYYSSYRGNGAIPGFTFKEKDNALAFMQFVGGDAVAAQEAVKEERNAYADDKAQSAVERLTEMADRLDERADESLGQERKANTSRRARFAASAEAAASSDKALAKTMRNIANAISEGSAKFLDKVRQKSQVEMLRSTIGQAKYQELITKYTSYANQEQHKGEPATAETADFARWPQFTAMRSDLASLGRDLLQIDGAKLLGKQLLKVADDVSDAYTKFAKENLYKVSVFSMKKEGSETTYPAIFSTEDKALEAINRSGHKGKAAVVSFKRGEHIVVMGPEMAKEKGLWSGDTDKRITLTPEFGEEIVAKNKAFGKRNRISMPYIFDNVSQERARWKALGIESPAEMRAALREFVGLQERPAEADKIKQMERAMIGRKNDGLDFFPTPANTAQDMIDAAEIEPGMSVLEPSAGMGHIAEQIREAGVDPDVIEYGYDRRELLEAKGFRVVGNDFMEMSPRGFTFGDIFKDQDGNLGVMRSSGGLGSNRVGLDPLDENGVPDQRRFAWVDRDSLVGVEKRAGNSGYDRIIMNPPFSDRRDAEHVQHAFTLLKPGGRIVAIMGEGVFFGQDAKAKSFREWLEKVGGTSEKLEEGTFLDPSLPVNTGANARLVVIDRPVGSVESDEVNQSNPYGPYHAKAVEFNNAPESDRVFQFGNGAGLGSVRRRGLSRQFGSIANGAPSKAYSTGVADFRGTSINGPEDLADIAQIYRNPSYETMRYFFVKNGAIVSQNAVSSRLPGSSNIFFGKSDAEKASWANQIAIEAKALGADGVYLLHNHPNGDPSASNEDMAATQTIIGMIEPHGIRVLDHVIINHNKYGVIETVQRNGQEELDWRVVNKDYNSDEQYSFANPKQAHPVIGALVYGPKNVAIAAKQAQVSPGQVVIVGTAGSNGVRLLAEVTPAQITNPKITIATIRRLSKQSGAAHLYAYGMPISATNSLAEMIRRGIFIDAIVVDESGVEWSVAGITGAHPKKGWHFGIESSGSEVEMTAWHGSPHDHNKFDSSKIGTGEGAQAYGHGLYFAGERSVAEYYRNAGSSAARLALDALNRSGGIAKEAIKELKKWDGGRNQSDFLDAISLLKTGNQNGRLYQVELAPSENEYLDWDKPLSEQSELVRDALIAAYTNASTPKNMARRFVDDEKGRTGEDFYREMQNRRFADEFGEGSAKSASDYLHSIGIRGIRYLDGSSRSAGEGSSNYVIFNDNDVSITAKFAKDAKRTSETPQSIRAALTGRFGSQGIAALEKSGMLKIMSVNDAPSAILETAIEQNASALYTIDGVAYLFSDRMTAQDAPGKLLHELGEHHGLATMLGDSGFKALTKRLVNMAKANGSIAAKAWEGVKTKYGEFNGKSFADLSGNERFIHEVLAAIGENKEGQKTSIWRELLAKIKSWLASKGLASDWLNEGDIVNLVNGSLKKIMRNAETGLVDQSTMASIITDHFKQIVEAMKADKSLVEDCA